MPNLAATAEAPPRAGHRLAAIDIGTNSIRCIIVEVDHRGQYRILDDEKINVRLGEGSGSGNIIEPPAWERAVAALSNFRKIIDGYQVGGIEAVATSAVRRAENGADFVADVANRTGIIVEVASGKEEAGLITTSALNNFDTNGHHIGVIDIGGGSLEIVTVAAGNVEEAHSVDLGAVFMTEMFERNDPWTVADLDRLRKHVRKVLQETLAVKKALHYIIGSGGTITSMAAMISALRKESFPSMQGYELLRSDMVHLLAMLQRKSLAERKSVPGLSPDRADIIIAGVVVINEVMGHLDVNVLKVNERGLRDGLVVRGLRKYGFIPETRQISDWRDGVIEFARSCHADDEHARQVARLSLQLFDALAPEFQMGARERQILEAAALLHDVGYLIGYSGHHKHSYHLISHAELFGFSPLERELIALTARYHRKAMPKKKHEVYTRLAAADQLLVSRLGGIVKIADGIDRRRNAAVLNISCAVSAKGLTVTIEGDGDLSVEIFSGKKKSDLLEAAFQRPVFLRDATSA